MAEALGIGAATLQIASAGMALAINIHKVCAEMANAGIQIFGVAQSVQLFSQTLRHVGHVFGEADPIHSRSAEDTVRQVHFLCSSIFDEIGSMISQVHTMGRIQQLSIVMRVKWCFRKGKVDHLLARLDSLKLTLSVLLQTISTAKMIAALEDRNLSPSRWQNLQNQIFQEKNEICTWLVTHHWSLIKLSRLRQLALQEHEEETVSTDEESAEEPTSRSLSLDTVEHGPLVPLAENALRSLDGATASIINPSQQLLMPHRELMVNYALQTWTMLPGTGIRSRSGRHTRQTDANPPPSGREDSHAHRSGPNPNSRTNHATRAGPSTQIRSTSRRSRNNAQSRPIPTSDRRPTRTEHVPETSQESRPRYAWREWETRPIIWRRGCERTGSWRQFVNERLDSYYIPGLGDNERVSRHSFGTDNWTEIANYWISEEALQTWQYPFVTYDRLSSRFHTDGAGMPVGETVRVTKMTHRISNALDYAEILDLVQLSNAIRLHRERPDRSTPSILSERRPPRRPSRVTELEYPFRPALEHYHEPWLLRCAAFVVPWHKHQRKATRA